MLFLLGLASMPLFFGLGIFYIVLGIIDSPKWFFVSIFNFIPVGVIWMCFMSLFQKNQKYKAWLEDQLGPDWF